MTRTILFTAALASAVGMFTLGAQAQQSAPQPMGVKQIATMLEEQGYTVREIELERNRYEVKMTDANGMRVKAYLDAATGEVLPYRDDDDYRRGDDDRRYGDDNRRYGDDD